MDGLSEERLNQLREYSLFDLLRTGLFKEYEENTVAFETNSGGLYLKLWYEEQVKVLERVENGVGKKLGFDPAGETWFFEKWYDEVFIKTWKQHDRYWGEIINKQGLGVEIKETWNFLLGEASYEHYHLQVDNEYGSKAGCKTDLSWKEIWHKKPGDSALEKYWVSPTAKWGEKSGQTGEKNWFLEWREENNSFEEKSRNEENGKTWGHVKGKDEKSEWGEQWSVEANQRKVNDRWWKENGRHWGINTINDVDSEYCEEWEEKFEYKKNVKSFKDPQGIRTRVTQGSGPGFEFFEDYKHDPAKDEHCTKSKGFSPEGKWESYIFKQGSKNYVKHKGEDANGNWEEEWDEDGETKKAWKKGKSTLWGEWEENWVETSGKKSCKKWGKKDEQWVEEWTEEPNTKTCRKEQIKEGKVHVQQWKEETTDDQTRSFGTFYEDGVIVKEWDYTKKSFL